MSGAKADISQDELERLLAIQSAARVLLAGAILRGRDLGKMCDWEYYNIPAGLFDGLRKEVEANLAR
jgi:hypothetical protein